MKEFNLSEWLQDKSRKVVTRDGRDARIVFTEAQDDNYPILALVQRKTETTKEQPHLFSTHGVYEVGRESCLDLFFADEEEKPQSIEIQFGAFDSEFIRDEYYIPEGCEARIEGNKVIIERVQKEDELTEFEKEVDAIIDENIKRNMGLKYEARNLLDLARKEILKDLPKWKDVSGKNGAGTKDYKIVGYYLVKGNYAIYLEDLEKLPKEE